MNTKMIGLVVALLVSVCSVAQQNYVCDVKLKNIPDGSVAYLVASFVRPNTRILDSVAIENSAFQFSGDINDPIGVHIIIKRAGQKMPVKETGDTRFVYLEKGKISIKGKGSLRNAKIRGSALNAEYAEFYKAVMLPMKRRLKPFEEIIARGPLTRGLADSIIRVMTEEKRIQDSLKWVYVQQNPAKYTSLVALNELAGKFPDVEKIESLYKKFPQELRNTLVGRDLGTRLSEEARVARGVTAYDFIQNDVNGKPIKLSDFRGRYVLLDFWASWCSPCRMENPHVVKAYEKYKNKNFTVLGVSLDGPGKRDAWLAAIEKDGLHWNNVSDLQGWNNAVAKLYGVKSIPQNFLIDPQGKIVARNLRGEELEKKLASLLN